MQCLGFSVTRYDELSRYGTLDPTWPSMRTSRDESLRWSGASALSDEGRFRVVKVVIIAVGITTIGRSLSCILKKMMIASKEDLAYVLAVVDDFVSLRGVIRSPSLKYGL